MESKKVVQHVYLVGAKSIYRVAEKDKEYLRDEEEKNQNTAYREMKTVAERANYSEYNESNQLMESVDILHRVFGY